MSKRMTYAQKLEAIIFWLDGLNGDFPIRKEGEGPYYWRHEMWKRFEEAKGKKIPQESWPVVVRKRKAVKNG